MSAASAESDALAEPTTAAHRLKAMVAVARSSLSLAGVCLALGGWLWVPQAWLIAEAMQRIFVAHDGIDAVTGLLFALLAVGLLRIAINTVARRVADRAVEQVRHSLRQHLLSNLLARGPRWIRQQRSGELAEAVTGHVDALEGYVGGFLPVRVEVVAVPLIILIAVFCVDRTVGAILLFTLPLAPIFMMLVGWGAEAASRQQLRAMARLGGHFADRLRALGLIRVYGRGEAELQGIARAAEGLRQSSLKVLRIAFLSSAVLEFFASISVAMIALYLGLSYLGMIDWRATPLTLSTGVFCLLLAPEFYAPLRRLATHYHDRAAALAAAEEIGAWFEEAHAPHRAPPVHATSADVLSAPAIRVRNLALRPSANAERIFESLSFSIAAGEHVALVGASGSGKTTLLEAFAGWLPVDAGGIDIDAPLSVGYVPQRPYLFHGSLADNLRLADPHASDDALRAAAEAAQVMRFATQLPRGLDTVIGERGFGLSGGEARRVALARVFLRRPNLLLLDEPTAFLDPDTETAVIDALLDFAQGRTLILATHSAAVIARMPRAIVLPQATKAVTP